MQEAGCLTLLYGRFTAALVFWYFPYAPPVTAFIAFLFRPDFVVGIPVALAILRFALVTPSKVFMLGFRLRISFICSLPKES